MTSVFQNMDGNYSSKLVTRIHLDIEGNTSSTFVWVNCLDEDTFVTFTYVLFAIIFFPTVFGNLLIIISIVKFRHLRSNMHVLIGNLAISDLIIALCVILQVIANFSPKLVNQKYFCLGQNCVFVISLGTSSFNMLAMSIERFTAIRFPLKHMSLFTRRKMYALITCCWTYHSIIASLPLIGWNNYDNDVIVCDTDIVWTKPYDILLFGSLFAVVIINGILCGLVMKTIVKKREMLRYASAISINSQNMKGHFRRTKMTMIVFGVFAICWLPYLIVSLLMTIYDRPLVRCARQWCTCLGIINSATNWIIYGLANKSFRDAFKAIIKGKQLVQFRRSVRHSHI